MNEINTNANDNTLTELKIEKSKTARKIIAIIFTVALILSGMICIICNGAISGRLTWALYPLSSLLFAWLIMIPLILSPQKGILLSLLSVSAFIIPYLFSIEQILGIKGSVMKVGIPASLLSILFLWIIYLLVAKTKLQRLTASGICLILAIPFTWLMNMTIDSLTMNVMNPYPNFWSLFGYSIAMVIALFMIGLDLLLHKKLIRA